MEWGWKRKGGGSWKKGQRIGSWVDIGLPDLVNKNTAHPVKIEFQIKNLI
jgi:hypothetical protein